MNDIVNLKCKDFVTIKEIVKKCIPEIKSNNTFVVDYITLSNDTNMSGKSQVQTMKAIHRLTNDLDVRNLFKKDEIILTDEELLEQKFVW